METVVSHADAGPTWGQPDPDFWRGRRVFVTGHTGFKGSWLLAWLHRYGAELFGYALAPLSPNDLYVQLGAGHWVNEVLSDVRDFDALRAHMQFAQPDVVIHLAAQPLVLASVADPVGTFGTNVMGTVHVLEAARQTPSVRALVNVTTDKVYAPLERPRALVESDPLGGFEPYSRSKACSEWVSACYHNTYFGRESPTRLASSTARAGNVLGAGDWAADRIVPDLVRAARDGAALWVRNPASVRPWQHVLEPLSGYLVLAQALARGEVTSGTHFNFGPDPTAAMPVGRLVERLAERWCVPVRNVDSPDTGVETDVLLLDSAQARHTLGWRPRWTFDDCCRAVFDGYDAMLKGDSARDICARQIDAYLCSELLPV